MSQLPAQSGKLAVLDSGVGGLTVLAELRMLLPDAHITYYADTANCPYGTKSNEEILELTVALVQKVVEMGAEIVVLACNTMTTVAIEIIRKKWPMVAFVGTQPALKPATMKSKTGVIGVLATQATLAGKSYKEIKKKFLLPKQKLVEVAGNGLVEFVEKGEHNTKQCGELLKSYIEPMIEQGVDVIVLGCTHYPFFRLQIDKIIGSRVILVINPAPSVASRVVDISNSRGMLFVPGQGVEEFYSSGSSSQLDFLKSLSGEI